MSKRQVWVIEVSDRGKDNWRPMNGEAFTDEAHARLNLRDFAEPPRELWEYRLAPYVPDQKEPR